MQFITQILALMWRIIESNKQCVVNICTNDGLVTVSVIIGRSTKRFTDKDGAVILQQLEHYLTV